jgi:hypothetical protein
VHIPIVETALVAEIGIIGSQYPGDKLFQRSPRSHGIIFPGYTDSPDARIFSDVSHQPGQGFFPGITDMEDSPATGFYQDTDCPDQMIHRDQINTPAAVSNLQRHDQVFLPIKGDPQFRCPPAIPVEDILQETFFHLQQKTDGIVEGIEPEAPAGGGISVYDRWSYNGQGHLAGVTQTADQPFRLVFGFFVMVGENRRPV